MQNRIDIFNFCNLEDVSLSVVSRRENSSKIIPDVISDVISEKLSKLNWVGCWNVQLMFVSIVGKVSCALVNLLFMGK